jgi:WD40 repeat protein
MAVDEASGLRTGRVVRVLEGHTHWVRAVAVTPDGGRAISGSFDEIAKVKD